MSDSNRLGVGTKIERAVGSHHPNTLFYIDCTFAQVQPDSTKSTSGQIGQEASGKLDEWVI